VLISADRRRRVTVEETFVKPATHGDDGRRRSAAEHQLDDADSCRVWFQLTAERQCSQRRLILTQPSCTASPTQRHINAE